MISGWPSRITSPSASCHSCTGALFTVVPLVELEVAHQRDLTVPPDLQMATGHTGVGKPELSVLAAADHVGAFAQLVRTTTAVVELQRDGGTAGRVVALAVTAAVAAARWPYSYSRPPGSAYPGSA